MTTVVMMRDKAHQMKGLVEEGLNIFGKVMTMCNDMCEGEFNQRTGGGYYGDKGMEYPPMPPQYPMPQMPYDPYMNMRQGVPGTGRYGMYR